MSFVSGCEWVGGRVPRQAKCSSVVRDDVEVREQ